MPLGVSLASTADLLLAVSDLKLVQLLRQAILVADLTSAAGRRVDQTSQIAESCRPRYPASACQPCEYIRPVAVIDRYENSRPVACVQSGYCRRPASIPTTVVAVVEKQRDTMESPLQPPWKVLPWENPPQPAPVIKMVRHAPDMLNKGTLLDCFI